MPEPSPLLLNADLLRASGYQILTSQQAAGLVADIYSTLESLVGHQLAGDLSPSKLTEFEALMDAGDEAAAYAWLEETLPMHRQQVESLYHELLDDLRRLAQEDGHAGAASRTEYSK